jgi:DNA-binding NtrC family response regulator
MYLDVILTQFDGVNCFLVAGSLYDEAGLEAVGYSKETLDKLGHVWLKLPELKDHPEELPEIASVFLEHMIESQECPLRYFSTASINLLRSHSWPGSYDELRNVLKNLALIALDEEIQVEDVEKILQKSLIATNSDMVSLFDLNRPLREAREMFEAFYFSYHIEQANGNMTKIAEKTGVERTHLYRKLKQLGLSTGKRD